VTSIVNGEYLAASRSVGETPRFMSLINRKKIKIYCNLKSDTVKKKN
jgi:hypothetical protein